MPTPITVVDVSATAYNIENHSLSLGINRVTDADMWEETYTGTHEDNTVVKDYAENLGILHGLWAYFLMYPRPERMLMGVWGSGAAEFGYEDYLSDRVVLACDQKLNKVYWRSRDYPDYKANRRTVTTIGYKSILKALEVVVSSLHLEDWLILLKKPGFEADDIASAIYRAYPDTPIVYHTVDSDWLGLMRPGDYYVDPTRQPAIMDYNAALAKIQRRYRDKPETILQCSDIYLLKRIYGDAADNIKPNTAPLGIISLVVPSTRFKLPELAWAEGSSVKGKRILRAMARNLLKTGYAPILSD
jgi:hypothetical protein